MCLTTRFFGSLFNATGSSPSTASQIICLSTSVCSALLIVLLFMPKNFSKYDKLSVQLSDLPLKRSQMPYSSSFSLLPMSLRAMCPLYQNHTLAFSSWYFLYFLATDRFIIALSLPGNSGCTHQ